MAFSFFALVVYQQYGFLIAAPLLMAAAILIPRERVASSTREEVRWSLLSRLQIEGFKLRVAHVEARQALLTPERAQLLWKSEREIVRWISSTESQIKRFPEIAFIFKFRSQQATTLSELDLCLQCIERMRRLCRLSQTLDLPI